MTSSTARIGFAKAATSGTRWTTLQGMLNRVATAVGMLIVARAMTPLEFGMASVVTAISGFVMVFPILVMGDVLITHQHHLATIAQVARRVTILATAVLVVAMAATAPLIAWWYEQYDFAPFAALLVLSATRPIAEAISIFPLTRLRISMHYREIALINGIVQFGSIILTVAWAVLWPSAAAIVMPQILAVLAKGVWYAIEARRLSSGTLGLRRRPDRALARRRPERAKSVARRITREFGVGSLAQYVHTVLSGLPLIVVSNFCDEATTGQFGFAFTLAAQTVMGLSYQLATVLQPIFGRLKTDPLRQIIGFRRVVGIIVALAVPVSLLQMALAEPVFSLFFGNKWMAAVPYFVAFSAGQAFGCVLAPAMALLKAQGRFGVYFLWQLLQGAACAALFPVAAISFGAAAVAWTDTVLWLVTMPIVVWIGSRRAGVGFVEVLRAFFVPWLTAGPIALVAWIVWHELPGSRTTASVIAFVVIGPVALFASMLAIRVTQPAVAAEIAPFMQRVLRRIPVAGAPLAAWFGSSARPPTEALAGSAR